MGDEQSEAPDVEGFNVSLTRVREILMRADLGDKALTFADGVALAYAFAERCRDELDQVALGDGDEEIEAITDELVTISHGVLFCHTGTRLVFENVTELQVPPEAKAADPQSGRVSVEETITGVAVRARGQVFQAPAPARHDQALGAAAKVLGPIREWAGEHEQGFVTSLGRFVDRRIAGAIAFYSGQTETRKSMLTSEDVW